jgi:hypothetical protein
VDIGCGSGLFSLAARRLSARVHSFDYDPQSVACAVELNRRYYPQDPDWTIGEASVLDEGIYDHSEYLRWSIPGGCYTIRAPYAGSQKLHRISCGRRRVVHCDL